MAYDKTKHSLNKLGWAGSRPVVPFLPVGAQFKLGVMGAVAHFKMDASGVYLNGILPSVIPSHTKALNDAIKTAKKAGAGLEESYSGTGSKYFKLTIDPPAPETPQLFGLRFQGVLIGHGVIDPGIEIASWDEDGDGDTVQTQTQTPAQAQAQAQAPADAAPAGTSADPDPDPADSTNSDGDGDGDGADDVDADDVNLD